MNQFNPLKTTGMRSLSTTAKGLVEYVWKGSEPVRYFEENLEMEMKKEPKLKDVTKVIVE